jgi:hypothetical protein
MSASGGGVGVYRGPWTAYAPGALAASFNAALLPPATPTNAALLPAHKNGDGVNVHWEALRMSEPAKVYEDRATPGEWCVEWFDDDGGCELEFFTGPDARRQALRYAIRRYGHFIDVELEEPHST